MSGVIFVNTLKSHWRGALYWGIGLAFLGFYILAVIPDSEVLNQFTQLAESLPPVLFQMFGGIDAASLGTPEGFISFGFFGYVLILLAFYAVMTGLNVTANEEDDGILDMVLSLPLPRWRVMLERFAAHALLTTGMVLISLLGLWLGGQRSVLELNMGRLAEATINILPGVFFMMALTIFAAVIVRRKAVAVGIVVTVIVVSYFLDFLGKSVTNDIVQAVQKLSFFTYYDTSDVIQHGLNIGDVSLLLGLTVVLVAGALWAFNRRDVGL